MSQRLAVSGPVATPRTGTPGRVAALDARRMLQLTLAVLWLLDGILQYQPSMFSHTFPQLLAGGAQGNPAIVAGPISWSANIIGHHLVALNAVFATTQLALGLGIAWRPTVKVALAASVAWSLGVWWFGEGLGGVLAGKASPVNGAPGAVILYAVAAILLWPAERDSAAPFVAARAVGRRAAQAAWLVLWGSLAFFALLPASRAPQAIGDMIAAMAPGEPGWLGWLDTHAASALSHQGLPASIVLAGLLALIAVGVYLPARSVRAIIALALAVAAVLWLAQGLGGVFTGSGTDLNSGPLLALMALAFWPAAATKAAATKAAATKAAATKTAATKTGGA